MNPDAFGGEDAVKERLVAHEASKRQKQDPQSVSVSVSVRVGLAPPQRFFGCLPPA